MKTPILALACFLSTLLFNPIFAAENAICEITSFVADYNADSCEGEIVFIDFDFNASEFGINGFTVEANGVVQTYNIGDVYEIFIISLCDEDVVLTITDNDDPNCTETITLGPACCDCEISTPVITTSECFVDFYEIYIDFFDNVGTCVSYNWFLTIDGVEYPLTWNSAMQRYEATGIIAIDLEVYFVELCNDSPLEECFGVDVENPCFVEDCEIPFFTADYVDGSCEGEIIIIEFEFDAVGFGVNGFEVSANGSVQEYVLGDEYMFYMITLCDDVVELIITDNDDPNCTASIILEPACCDCVIDDPVITTSDCLNNTFDIYIDFFSTMGTCVNYNWFLTVDGEDYPLTWNQSTLQYEGFDLSSPDDLVVINLCNDSPLEECWAYTIVNPCYDGDCEITSFTANYVPDSCEGEGIAVEFDFNASGFGANGFTVDIDGVSQVFNIGDDYILTAITYCVDDVVLTITDNDDPNCTETLILEPACCDCEISTPLISTSACDNGFFDIFIDFVTIGGTCVNYDWFISVDGTTYPLVWNSTNQNLEAIGLSVTGFQFTILLCNESLLNECYTFVVNNPCFVSTSNCMINSFTAAYVDDSCIGEIIQFEFDIDATEFGANGFMVSANGDSQFYNLGDDYSFYVISDCSQDVVVSIADADDPSCQASVNLGPACCPCVIDQPIFETTACDNGSFNILIDFFNYEGTCVSYDWFITYNGSDYDLTWNATSQQYEAFNIMSSDSLTIFTLCNDSPLTECYTNQVVNPCFVSGQTCVLNSFTAEYNISSCIGEIVDIDFEFVGSGFGANGFEVTAGGFTQSYNLGDDYSITVVNLCVEDIILTITDANDPNCQASIIIGPACCDCEIEEPTIETSACTNNTFNIFIDYFDVSGTCVGYGWYVDVEGNEYELLWNSTNQYYEVIGLMAMDSLITIMLCNEGPLNECWSYDIINPCYEGVNDCFINSFTAAYDTTSCDGEIIAFNFEFDATEFGINGFQVWANGDTQNYNLGDDYFLWLLSDCMDDILVVITDNDNPNCQAEFILGPACCDCEFTDPEFEVLECEAGSFDLVLDFFNYEGTCVTYPWVIYIDGVEYDLTWNGANYGIMDLQSADDIITVELCNLSPLEECYTYQVENPCIVDEVECMITSFVPTLDTIACDNLGNALVILDFDIVGEGPAGYSVSIDGVEVGIYDYPPGIEISVPSNCNVPVNITIQDVELADCTASTDIVVCCPSNLSSTETPLENFASYYYDLNGDIILSSLLEQAVTVNLFSIDGKTIYQKTLFQRASDKISMTNFPKGIYILNMMNSEGQAVNYKIMNLMY